MAENIRLITYAEQTVTPMNDAILQDAGIGTDGILHGVDVSANGNAIVVSSGYGVIRGRLFKVSSTSIPVTLSSGANTPGRVYIKLDLSNTEEPIEIKTVVASTLPALEQDEDANYNNGVYEIELGTFTVTATNIIDVTKTLKTIHNGYVNISESGTSMDDYTDEGVYSFTGDYIPSDAPGTSSAGWLVVTGKRGSAFRQFFLQGSAIANQHYNVYARTYSSGAWTAWARFVAESEVFYLPGDRAYLPFGSGGFITGGTANVRFRSPWGKLLSSQITDVRLISGNITIRQNNQYLANGLQLTQESGNSGNAYPELDVNGLWMTVTKNGGFGGTNNDAVGIVGSCIVEFS